MLHELLLPRYIEPHFVPFDIRCHNLYAKNGRLCNVYTRYWNFCANWKFWCFFRSVTWTTSVDFEVFCFQIWLDNQRFLAPPVVKICNCRHGFKSHLYFSFTYSVLMISRKTTVASLFSNSFHISDLVAMLAKLRTQIFRPLWW